MSDPQIRYETNELRLLFEVSQALEGVTELSDNLSAALKLMARYTGMMRGMLTLLEPGSTDIMAEASYGLKSDERNKSSYKPGEGIISRVIESGKAMLLPKASQEPLFLSRARSSGLSKEDISFICVPIVLNNRPVGALLADRLFADSVRPEEDERLLQVLASLVARAVKLRQAFHTMHSAVVSENRRLQQTVRGRFHSDGLLAASASMRSLIADLAQISNLNSTVLLRGESGTGKELAASIIHSNSQRSGKPFIKAHCAGLPEGLMEAELFGHEQGGRKGRLEMAHGGTLFLDELGDMSPLIQARLLRFMEEREFERVGGSEAVRVDVRLVAASTRDLEGMVARGEFRQDLYYLLSVFPIILPPLRERRADIMPLVTHFIDVLSQTGGSKILRISAPAADLLINYGWPGNIRELANVMERALILGGAGGIIEPHHLPPGMQDAESRRGKSLVDTSGKLDDALVALEKRMLTDALEAAGGNMARAARQLGVSERVMGLRMKKYGFDYRPFRKIDKGR